MKKKNKIKFNLLTVLAFVIMLTNSCKKDDEINISSINFNPSLTYGTVTDIDGNVYKTIIIGDQTWMAENLNVIRYRNGDPIPNVKSNSSWNNLTTGAYCN